MSETICEVHGVEWKVIPAGVSKKTGRAYDSFRVCEVAECKERPPSAQKPHQQAPSPVVLAPSMADHVVLSDGYKSALREVIQDELAPIREENRRLLKGLGEIWKAVTGKSEVISDEENDKIAEKLGGGTVNG